MNESGTGYENRITVCIHAPAERVWEALVTPAILKQWFFGVDTETDWKVGSRLVHRAPMAGKAYEDKGVVLAFEPPRLLSHSHWSPFSGRADRPENYETVTYGLAVRAQDTDLTVSEVNLPSEEARVISEKNWRGALRKLKDLVESQVSSERPA